MYNPMKVSVAIPNVQPMPEHWVYQREPSQTTFLLPDSNSDGSVSSFQNLSRDIKGGSGMDVLPVAILFGGVDVNLVLHGDTGGCVQPVDSLRPLTLNWYSLGKNTSQVAQPHHDETPSWVHHFSVQIYFVNHYNILSVIKLVKKFNICHVWHKIISLMYTSIIWPKQVHLFFS